MAKKPTATPVPIRIPALFDTATLDGYPGVELRVRLNPSEAVWADFRAGGFSIQPQEQGLRDALQEMIDYPIEGAEAPEVYQARITELDAAIAERCIRMGRAFHAFFGTTPPLAVAVEQPDGTLTDVTLDFTTPEAALATAEDTRLPADLATWLVALPLAAREHRAETIRSKSLSSFGTKNA